MRPFLTANWRYLAMLNYVVDPCLIEPLVPPGTEIDYENGQTFLSIVGFLFLDTRLLGLPIPLHRDFEEVNLALLCSEEDRLTRGGAASFSFVSLFRGALSPPSRGHFMAKPYLAVPMKHEIEHVDLRREVEYSWRRGKKWESIKMKATGEPQSIPAGSHAEFITEHYWGYTCLQAGCSEYRVEHPRWKVWNADDFEFNADVPQSLRRTIRRNFGKPAALRIYCRRFAHYR